MGNFFIDFGGNDLVPLTAFGGCFEKVLGVEYEDCYFSTRELSPTMLQWFADARAGHPSAMREFTVYHYNEAFQLAGRLDLQDAFLREFRISDFDSSSSENIVFTFVAVPRRITAAPASGSPPSLGTKPAILLSGAFRLTVDGGLDTNRVTSVRGLRATWSKVPVAPVGGFHVFQPGPAMFDNIAITTSIVSIASFNLWFEQASGGHPAARDGVLAMLSQNLSTTLFTIQLSDLVPLQFPPFSPELSSSRRTMVVRLGGFLLVQ